MTTNYSKRMPGISKINPCPIGSGNEEPGPPPAVPVQRLAFIPGELYLFHPTDPACPAEESLWGVFDKTENGTILLESSSHDLKYFRVWHPLTDEYRFARLASRDELRDYAMKLARYEYCMEIRHLIEAAL